MENCRNQIMTRAAGAFCLLLLLGACSNPVGLTSSTMVPEQEALTYFQWLRLASKDALGVEQAQLQRTPSQPLRDIKLALLLTIEDETAATQQQQAEQLLTAALTRVTLLPEDYRVLAQHWLEVLQLRTQLQQVAAMQRQTDAELAAVRRQLGALEQSHAIQTETVNSLQAQKTLLEQQNRLMQKQIESITAIEQQLVEQDRRKNAPP